MSTSGRFGTFGGVFTPSILTILGVIMFLRLPMIVGEAGLVPTLAIILIAHLISFTTGLSVASIATDKRVKIGGTYYMISRSLGLPIGGTLGLALFVGLSFSVSLYLIGFAESFLSYWDIAATKDNIRIAGTIVLIAVTAITLISTSLAIKTQYFIMAAIALSLISVFFGQHELAPGQVPPMDMGDAIPFMVLFGIFFPAVTGFEAGVSMSGDLKDPKRSIPVGSIAAIVIGLIAYIGLTVFLVETVDAGSLANDPQILLNISLVPQLVVAGIWGATLSSALGSILGAPRILQATALDKITHGVFAKGSGRSAEPRNALLLTFVIAEAGILIGELDVIARIVSIFFITTYGFLNLSCAFERWTSTDFRPEFQTPIWVSITGAAACFLVMIQLDILAAIGGTILLGGLFLILKRKELQLESGDTWSGVWTSLVKSGIERLTRSDMHERNWRPNIILFSTPDTQAGHLNTLGTAITGRIGMLSRFEFVVGGEPSLDRLEEVGVDDDAPGFAYRYACVDIFSGMRDVVRLYGFTGVRPNTVLMEWNSRAKSKDDFRTYLRTLDKTDMNVVFLNQDVGKGFGSATTIDLWWTGDGSDVSFAITLLRLITTSPVWKHAHMRLLIISNDSSRTERIYRRAQRMLDEYRITMEVRIIENDHERLSAKEIIQRESAAADLTVLGLTGATGGDIAQDAAQTDDILEALGTTMIVHSSSHFQDLDIGIDPDHERVAAPQEREVPLPPLVPLFSQDLFADAVRIDGNAQRALRLLYERVPYPWIAELRDTAQSFRTIGEATYTSIDRITTFKEKYRRRRAILRIQNDFLYRCSSLIDTLKTESIAMHQESIAEGIGKYAEKLQTDVRRFPKTMMLQYPDALLQRLPQDSALLTVIKTWKRIQRKISGKQAERQVPYRSAAEHHFLMSRHVFLDDYLRQFSHEGAQILLDLKTIMISMATDLVELEGVIIQRELKPEDVSSRLEAFQTEMTRLHGHIERTEHFLLHRLLLEFRKNLVDFQNTLSRFDAATVIAGNRLPAKTFRASSQRNHGFAPRWAESMEHVINKVYLDISIASLRGRVNDRIEEFSASVTQSVDAYLSKPLRSLQTALTTAAEGSSDAPLEFSVARSFDLTDGLEETHEDVLELTRSLPDALQVVEGAAAGTTVGETVDIPVVRLTQYHLEADLLGPLEEYLTDTTEKLRKAAYTVKDLVNLTQFGIENINPDVADRTASTGSLLKNALGRAERELQKTTAVREEIHSTIHAKVDAAFDTLAPHMIEKSSNEFTDVLRDYKSRKVATAFGEFGRRVGSMLEDGIVRLMYGRIEGVLLAKKLTTATPQNLASRVRSFVENVSPRPEVIQALPQFYINLFSGRSSIGDEFWIERPEESDLFGRAVRRSRAGQRGTIVVLGERNSGKTAFCRNISSQYFKRGFNFHVFAPREGSVDLAVFEQTLAKATGHQGDAATVIRSLPRGSVLVFHDLELWFERQPTGLEVLRKIHHIVEDVGQDVLVVLNSKVSSYELICQLVPFRELAIEVITLSPMNAVDLSSLISLRHQSSSWSFQLGRTPEQEMSGLRRARLFGKYFDASDGNPGSALDLWLSSIERVKGDTLIIRQPEDVPAVVLDTLPDDWLMVLAQCTLHKRLTVQKVTRITGMPAPGVQRLLRHMQAAGLIEERIPGVFMINQFIDPYVQILLRRRKLL